MLVKIEPKSRITLPQSILTELKLSEGDHLEIATEDGMIYLIPITVLPKNYVESLKEEVALIKYKIARGETPLFDSIDELLDELESR